MASEAWTLIKEFIRPGSTEGLAIPPLDGGWTPNDRLDRIPHSVTGLTEVDDVALLPDGRAVVTSGSNLVELSGRGFTSSRLLARLPGPAGPIAVTPDGDMLVGVAGHGLMRVAANQEAELVVGQADDGQPLHCITDLCMDDAGGLYLTDGSAHHTTEEWVHDLMEQRSSGRLLRVPSAGGTATVVTAGLAYPAGVAVAPGGEDVVVAEAWTHTLTRVSVPTGRKQVLRANLPGYPGRIHPAGDGFTLAVFALRTQLVDFVLTQRDFVDQMTSSIDPDYWIRPALRSLDSGLEPLQGGRIRKLGVVKPWAPPRSYGLAVRLDSEGIVTGSMHSRSDGHRHGVTSVRQFGDELFIAARGSHELLITHAGDL